MPITIPPAHIIGDLGHTTVHNQIVGVLNAVPGALFSVLNSAYAGGADPAGVAASDAAFNAAVAAVPATGGMIVVPPGTYKLATGVTVSLGSGAGPVVFWLLPGVLINYTGTGDCFRFKTTGVSAPSGRGSGIIGGGVIDGTSAGAGSNGIHIGDIAAPLLYGTVQNFSGAGSAGLYIHNVLTWCEQTVASMFLNNCTQHVVFDGTPSSTRSSFSYSSYQFRIGANAAQDGVVIKNGAALYGTEQLMITGNFATSASPFTNYVLRISGLDTGSNGCQLVGNVTIRVEADGGLANAHGNVLTDANVFYRGFGLVETLNIAVSSIAGDFIHLGGEYTDTNFIKGSWKGPVSSSHAGFSGTVSYRLTGEGDQVSINGGFTVTAATVINQFDTIFTLPAAYSNPNGCQLTGWYIPHGAAPQPADLFVNSGGVVSWNGAAVTAPAGGTSGINLTATYPLPL